MPWLVQGILHAYLTDLYTHFCFQQVPWPTSNWLRRSPCLKSKLMFLSTWLPFKSHYLIWGFCGGFSQRVIWKSTQWVIFSHPITPFHLITSLFSIRSYLLFCLLQVFLVNPTSFLGESFLSQEKPVDALNQKDPHHQLWVVFNKHLRSLYRLFAFIVPSSLSPCGLCRQCCSFAFPPSRHRRERRGRSPSLEERE